MAEAWFVMVAFCLVMYVVLDGYDLGIGVLMIFERDPLRRRQFVELVATAWDGNESWLILLGVALWGGLPGAYGTMFPALYLPVIVMLFALIFRGVAIELVSSGRSAGGRWGKAFAVGSVLAAFAQGVVLGGLLSGVTITDGLFAGRTFDFLTPYSVLTGISAVTLYALAGAAVLQLKMEGPARARAAATGRVLVPIVGVLSAICALSLGATDTRPELSSTGRLIPVSIAVVLAAGGLVYAMHGFGRKPDWRPITGVVIAEVAGLFALLAAIHPLVVPPRLTIELAAAPSGALNFLLIGIGVNLPLVLFYNWYAHHVFRGKYRSAEPERAAGVSVAAAELAPSRHRPAVSEGVAAGEASREVPR